MVLLRVLKTHQGIIKSYTIQKFEEAGKSLRLKLSVELIDCTTLYDRETAIGGIKRRYSYHWQKPNGDLIVRWDNAAHWPEITTFPHHKHLSRKPSPQPSYELNLEAVFSFISKRLKTGE